MSATKWGRRWLLMAVCCTWLVPCAAVATSDADATAHAHGLVQQRAERGLIIDKRSLAVGVDMMMESKLVTSYTLSTPFRFGVHKKAELFVTPKLQSIEPTYSLADLGAKYRFRDGLLEMVARASLQFAKQGSASKVGLDIGMPMRVHLRQNLSLDAAPSLTFILSPDKDWFPRLPLEGNFNLTDAVAFTGGTELSLQDGSAGASGMTIGGSWTGATDGKPWMEVGARASWGNENNVGVMTMLIYLRYYGHLASRKARKVRDDFG